MTPMTRQYEVSLGPLVIQFHRTVRIKPGRSAAALPPSLGLIRLHATRDYRSNTPSQWGDDSYFMALHDVEATWISFIPRLCPAAVMVGAGGINALTGDKLGITLAPGNYCVAPPQRWLDGWKGPDDTVYQFVATPYSDGKGATVGEQLIGEESKTGAIALAIFEPKDREAVKMKAVPSIYMTGSGLAPFLTQAGGACGQTTNSTVMAWSAGEEIYGNSLEVAHNALPIMKHSLLPPVGMKGASLQAKSARGQSATRLRAREMGMGKGGKITQAVYPDPHGIG